MNDTDNPYASPTCVVPDTEPPEIGPLAVRGRRIYFGLLTFNVLFNAWGLVIHGIVYPAVFVPGIIFEIGLWYGIWRGWKWVIVLCGVLKGLFVLSECLDPFVVPITAIRVVAFALALAVPVLLVFSKGLHEFFRYQRSAVEWAKRNSTVKRRRPLKSSRQETQRAPPA